jgi:hypothetical protein
MRRALPFAAVALAAATLTACSGGDDDEAVRSETAPASTAAASTTAADDQPADETAPASTDAPSATTTPATSTTTTTTTQAPGVLPDVATLDLLTSGSGLGPRPLLRWEAVDGATAYVVTVNRPGGGPIWAWEGATTEVPYGGGPADDPDTTGARLEEPATWFVAAKDAEGRLLAVSGRVDIAP